MSNFAPPIRRTTVRTLPQFTTSAGTPSSAFRIGIYGPEGVGKTSLAALCPSIQIANVENSRENPAWSYVRGISVPGDYAASWENLRAWVRSLDGGVACIDSMTRAEDWATAWVIKNKKSNEGTAAADSIEDFKYKAGFTFVIDEFRRFIGDLDNAYLRGVSLVMVAHNRLAKTKNPDGSDYVRQEPRLIDDMKASNMLQWVQFLDHLLFVDLDKNVSKGKAEGSGSRTIYFDTHPSRLTKTRSLPKEPMEFVEGSTDLWKLLGK